jgi:hypothetical protein
MNVVDSRPTPRYRHRPKLFLGVSPLLWTGTLAVCAILAGILYCLLTRELPI